MLTEMCLCVCRHADSSPVYTDRDFTEMKAANTMMAVTTIGMRPGVKGLKEDSELRLRKCKTMEHPE